MDNQYAQEDTQTDISEFSMMHTCSLCGDYVTLPCETCSIFYADDLPLEEVLMIEELEDITEWM